MGTAARRKRIQEYLSGKEMLTVDEAVRLFDASPATIRRDFAEIAQNGGVIRLRGGIRRLANRQDELIPFILRAKWYSEEKRYLAWRVHEYVRNVKTLFVDGGSTTTHLGIFLRDPRQVIITNSLPLCNVIAEVFPSGGGPQVHVTGGCFQPESGLFLGSNAETAAAAYHADAAVLSARGVTPEGFFNHNEAIAGINRSMIAHADRVILMADHSKIGASAMNLVSSWEKIEALFTVETAENRRCLDAIRARGVKVFSDYPLKKL
ncbi:MAG: DeoR/GlpR transcriptional regulator [Lentisphaeria bacterium]|nr:DeoR/GlpR transcriptional regulator [Lentisphaeria bacterium]